MIISEHIVMRSAAGWYIGQCYISDDAMGQEGIEAAHLAIGEPLTNGWPYDRHSSYYATEADAAAALKQGQYTRY